MKLPPQTYEQYKKMNQDRQGNNNSSGNLKQGSTQRQIQSASNKDRDKSLGFQNTGHNTNSQEPKSSQPLRNQDNQSTRPLTGSNQNQNQAATSSAKQPSHKASSSQNEKIQQEKVLITGDDILIEYVDRLMNQLKLMGEEQLLQDQWKKAIEKFITHYVWHSQDRRKVEGPMTGIIDRLEGRLHEMQERRRRLIKYLYKKEGKLDEFEEGFHQSINKKSTIIKKFSSIQLEDLLRTSTKNVA